MAQHPITTVIRGGLVWSGGDPSTFHPDHDLVIEDGQVAAIEPGYKGRADHELDADGCLVLPGLINAHTHAGATPQSRSVAEDIDLPEAGAFYHSLIPLLGLGYSDLSHDEFAAIMEWDAIAMLLGGATTVVEENFGGADIWIDLVERLGFRSNLGLTFPGNVSAIGYVKEGKVVYEDPGDVAGGLRRNLELHDEHHGAFNDRLRIHLSPHAPDTVPEDVLIATAAEAEARDITIHLHVSQHQSEVDAIRDRANASPVEYLKQIGFLGPRVLATHVTYTDESDWQIFADTGTSIVHCPYRKAKEGMTSPFWEYVERGVNVAMGTDSFSHDLIEDLRLAAILGKVRQESVGVPAAEVPVLAATLGGAKALGRDDLGSLKAGARGDAIVVDLNTPFNFPVFDAMRSFVYYSSGANLRHSVVDGVPVVEDRKVLGTDMNAVRERANQACRRLWDLAAESDALPVGAIWHP